MKMKTDDLIHSLANEARAVTPLPTPARLVWQLGRILLLYALITEYALGVRVDLATQLQRPFFLAEILLLLTVISSSVFAAICLLFPDRYQNKTALSLPLYSLGAFVLVLLVQAVLPLDNAMVLPMGKAHALECTLCIAAVAIFPSAGLMLYLRKGASVYPFLSGLYAVLASSGIGCIMLRLAEANDSLLHLTLWHYIPTLLFAAIGALIGKICLKW